MTKKYYEILEVSETATAEEIKKSYRKLSLKWHPDRQSGKSLDEKKQANEKMQEINRAYEILGDEEKRKRYDLGDVNFTFSSGYNYGYEEELGNISDELKRLREEQKILARKDAINMIDLEMLITEIFPSKLDSSLWSPYNHWQEKVWRIKIDDDDTNEYGIDTSELDKFKETMINAIRKREEEWKTGINNPYFDKTKAHAIETIEEAMKEKGLKVEDLGEYSNYQEQINNLNRQWKIRSLKDKIVVYIKNIGKSGEEIKEKGSTFLNEFLDNHSYPEKKEKTGKYSKFNSELKDYDNTESKKIKEPTQIEQEKVKHPSSSNEKVKKRYENLTREDLIKKIEELEAEIRELKQEKPETPEEVYEYQSYVSKKEAKLQEYKSLLNSNNQEQQPISDNKFSSELLIFGGIGVIVIFLLTLLIRKKRNKLR